MAGTKPRLLLSFSKPVANRSPILHLNFTHLRLVRQFPHLREHLHHLRLRLLRQFLHHREVRLSTVSVSASFIFANSSSSMWQQPTRG
ncbi:hypothetical protein QVD17_17844 [Tagetes erecta]|uniref:Uncharacterized protein n=1 Tax=Tagetes erecta TaxID=13708 RepID=A0AAD8KK28_TARER|nr:hypothetical protein QVD17_17844 [Tagetes erecta]